MIFASAGYKVSLYDVLSEQIENAKNTIQHTLQDYHQKGCLKGSLSPEEQFGLISGTPVLRECLEDAIFIQESVPEILQIKHQVYRAIDIFMSSNTILSSSTSSFLPSVLSEHSTHRSQFIVAHPVNPPYFIPLVEIVPAAWTSERVITRTREIMTEIGMKPV
ncbi:lambda-crystallin homolog, partial [Diaphorina citri]